jgi:hypothetical protein
VRLRCPAGHFEPWASPSSGHAANDSRLFDDLSSLEIGLQDSDETTDEPSDVKAEVEAALAKVRL